MAYPTILINSTGGASPPAASGAGPTTALTGTNASIVSNFVTLDGSPNLTPIATDGSHAIYINTTTGRKFFKITGKNVGAFQVVVEDNPAGTLTGRSWAIGGKLSSLQYAGILLIDQAGAAGDMKGGWVAEMQSGHVEGGSGEINVRCGGDAAGGPILIRAAAGAAVKPIMVFSGDTRGLVLRGAGLIVRDITLRSTGAKTNSVTGCALTAYTSSCTVVGLTIESDTLANKWYHGLLGVSGQFVPFTVGCTFDRFGGDAIRADGGPIVVRNCFLRGAAGCGIALTAGSYFGVGIEDNIFDSNASACIYFANLRTDYLGTYCTICGNTFRGSTAADSLRIDHQNANAQICRMLVMNNIFYQSGAYDIDFLNVTQCGATYYGAVILSNSHYQPTSGFLNPASNVEHDWMNTDPQFADSANGNFAIGDNLKGHGYPTGPLGVTYSGASGSTRTFVDVGGAQRLEEEYGPCASFPNARGGIQ